jgi:hypothetical protein
MALRTLRVSSSYNADKENELSEFCLSMLAMTTSHLILAKSSSFRFQTLTLASRYAVAMAMESTDTSDGLFMSGSSITMVEAFKQRCASKARERKSERS